MRLRREKTWWRRRKNEEWWSWLQWLSSFGCRSTAHALGHASDCDVSFDSRVPQHPILFPALRIESSGWGYGDCGVYSKSPNFGEIWLWNRGYFGIDCPAFVIRVPGCHPGRHQIVSSLIGSSIFYGWDSGCGDNLQLFLQSGSDSPRPFVGFILVLYDAS